MSAAQWVRVTAAENIPLRQGRSVQFGGMAVAIFNLGDRFVALENRCPHRGGPLSDGIVSAAGNAISVTCPLHNWRVCIDSGRVLKPAGDHAACARTFEVKIEDGIVMLDLNRELSEAAA